MAAVKDETGKPLGYLVRWRRLASTSDPQVVRDLLGSDASIYLGNIKGDVWINLVRPVHLPPQGLSATSDRDPLPARWKLGDGPGATDCRHAFFPRC